MVKPPSTSHVAVATAFRADSSTPERPHRESGSRIVSSRGSTIACRGEKCAGETTRQGRWTRFNHLGCANNSRWWRCILWELRWGSWLNCWGKLWHKQNATGFITIIYLRYNKFVYWNMWSHVIYNDKEFSLLNQSKYHCHTEETSLLILCIFFIDTIWKYLN